MQLFSSALNTYHCKWRKSTVRSAEPDQTHCIYMYICLEQSSAYMLIAKFTSFRDPNMKPVMFNSAHCPALSRFLDFFFEYSSISLVLVYIISVCCRETHDYYWRATCIHQTIIQMVRYIMHHDSCAISNTPQTEGEHCLCICWVECSLMTSFYRAPFTSVCGLCSSSGQNMCMQWRGCMQH